MTSACTTGCARGIRKPCEIICGPDWITRTAWPASSEDHDEPRAAATFRRGRPRSFSDGHLSGAGPAVFFIRGQFDGRLKRISPHLIRGPHEPPNSAIRQFYDRLLELLRRPVLRQGEWRLLECTPPAWEGNPSCDAVIAYAWQDSAGKRLIVSVNTCESSEPVLRPAPVRWPCWPALAATRTCWARPSTIATAMTCDRAGSILMCRLWQYHVFEMTGV